MFQAEADNITRPLHIDLRNMSRLTSIFHFTPYVKGNCVAHMMYHFLGERVFLSSIRRYVREYQYRNADQEDLWSAFQVEIDRASVGLPASSRPRMKDVMRTWTYHAGFPILRVRQNRETGAIELTQVRLDTYRADRFFRRMLFHLATASCTTNYLLEGMRVLIIVMRAMRTRKTRSPRVVLPREEIIRSALRSPRFYSVDYYINYYLADSSEIDPFFYSNFTELDLLSRPFC